MVHGWWRKPSSRSPCWRLQKTCCFDGLPLRWRDSGDWWFSERLNDFHEQVCASAQQHPWRCPPLRHWLDMLFNILLEFHFILLLTENRAATLIYLCVFHFQLFCSGILIASLKHRLATGMLVCIHPCKYFMLSLIEGCRSDVLMFYILLITVVYIYRQIVYVWYYKWWL